MNAADATKEALDALEASGNPDPEEVLETEAPEVDEAGQTEEGESAEEGEAPEPGEPEEDLSDTTYEVDGEEVTLGELVEARRKAKSIQADATKKWTEAADMKRAAEQLQNLTRQTMAQTQTTRPPAPAPTLSLDGLPSPLDNEKGWAEGIAQRVLAAAQQQGQSITPEQVQQMVASAIQPIQAKADFDSVEGQFRAAHQDLTDADVEAVISEAWSAVQRGLIDPASIRDASGKANTEFLEDALVLHQAHSGTRQQDLKAAKLAGKKEVLRQINPKRTGGKPLRSGGGKPPKTTPTRADLAKMTTKELANYSDAELDALWRAGE